MVRKTWGNTNSYYGNTTMGTLNMGNLYIGKFWENQGKISGEAWEDMDNQLKDMFDCQDLVGMH